MNEISMNIKNVKTTPNLFMRKQLRLLRLEATANGIKKMKSQLNIFLVSNSKRSVKALVRKLEVNGTEIYDDRKVNDEIKISLRKTVNVIKKNSSQIFLPF